MTQGETELRVAIWNDLRGAIGDDRLQLWLSDETCIVPQDGVLGVIARNAFAAERIRRSIGRELRAIASRHGLSTVQVEATPTRIAGPIAPETKSTDRPADAAHLRVVGESSSDAVARGTPGVASTEPRAPELRFPETFETFVVSDGSRAALQIARNIVDRPGLASPALFVGTTGSGKSHVLKGIRHACRTSARRVRSLALAADQFTSLFVEALHGRGLPIFRQKFRDLDLLIIDDVQQLVGRRATLIELHQTVAMLHQEGKQVVFASDRPVSELQGLGPELVGRLQAGVTCALATPEEATRRTMLKARCEWLKVQVADETIDALAAQLPADGRLTCAAANRLALMGEGESGELSWEFVRATVADLLRMESAPVRFDAIDQAVADLMKVPVERLRSDEKSRDVSAARMVAMWLARKHVRCGYAEIGHHFGGRSHSTAIAAKQRIDAMIAARERFPGARDDLSVADAVSRIEARLRLA